MSGADVAVAGGGPAGALAALTMARHGLSVVVLEASRYDSPRVGETLPPAARPLLRRLGLDDEVAALAAPAHGNASAWGSGEVTALPFVATPYGNGWHLDRRAFDELLAQRARDAGVTVRTGVRVTACRSGDDGVFHLELDDGGSVVAAAALDATGRGATLARHLGARPVPLDRLVGVVARYRADSHDGGPTLVEASTEGWHYSAPVPPDGYVVTYLTDADLWDAATVWDALLPPATADRLRGASLVSAPTLVSARSHRLDRADAPGRWLAAGDAALAVDPLASAGLAQALRTGEAAGLALAHWLVGDEGPARAYERLLDDEWSRYQVERAAYYALEDRWPDSPFWRRRTAA